MEIISYEAWSTADRIYCQPCAINIIEACGNSSDSPAPLLYRGAEKVLYLCESCATNLVEVEGWNF
jgi:hypothetical protein